MTHVDYGRPDRAPLLVVTGEIDHVVPPAIGEAIVKSDLTDMSDIMMELLKHMKE